MPNWFWNCGQPFGRFGLDRELASTLSNAAGSIGQIGDLTKKMTLMTVPTSTTLLRTRDFGNARARYAPAYAPTVAIAIMRRASGHATMPAELNITTEMADSTNESPFFSPFSPCRRSGDRLDTGASFRRRSRRYPIRVCRSGSPIRTISAFLR